VKYQDVPTVEMRAGAIFSPVEQLSIASDRYLRSYRAITRNQLTGLLAALGEYSVRVGPNYLPEGVRDRELVKAHGMITGSYRRAHWTVDSSASSPWLASLSSRDDFVFDSREQKELALHKYIRGREGITKGELLALLGALGQYSRDAPAMKELPYQLGDALDGVRRIIHAHNALVAFGDRPFTLDEFGQSVCAVLHGDVSQLTRS